ncbi:hypothetical protein IMG5_010440, partial [Ichthyophthirius multifiliis]
MDSNDDELLEEGFDESIGEENQGDQDDNYDDGQQSNETEYNTQVIVPDSYKQLKACIGCYLILTAEQVKIKQVLLFLQNNKIKKWKKMKDCPNCNDQYQQQTTKFQGLQCITDPKKSWLTYRMKKVKDIR